MRWFVKVIICLFFLGVVVRLGYIYYTRNLSKIINVEVVSEMKDMKQIQISDRLVLNDWLNKIGYTKPMVDIRLPRATNAVAVTSLKIIYTDEKQNGYAVAGVGGEIVQTAGFSYDEINKKLTVLIQSNRENGLNESNYLKSLEYTTLSTLINIKMPQGVGLEPFNIMWNTVASDKNNKGFLGLKWNFLSNVVKAVYASCGGSFRCGKLNGECGGVGPGCSVQGLPCLTNGGLPSTCNVSCSYLSDPESCSDFATVAGCQSATAACDTDDHLGCNTGGCNEVAAPTSPPADCNGSCYTGNCPGDMVGHGQGSCAVGQYYCTVGSCGGGGGDGPVHCSQALAPTNLALTKTSSSTWDLTWSGGDYPEAELAYGTDHDTVANQNFCCIKLTDSEIAAKRYTIRGLTEGTIYYFRIWVFDHNDNDWPCTSNLFNTLSSCDLSVDGLVVNSLTVAKGQSVGVVSNVATGSPDYSKYRYVIKVDYTTDNNFITPTNCSDYAGVNMEAICNSHPDCYYGNSFNHGCYYKGLADDVISIDPSSDGSYVYGTKITGLQTNQEDITTLTASTYFGANGYMDSHNVISPAVCTVTIPVTVTAIPSLSNLVLNNADGTAVLANSHNQNNICQSIFATSSDPKKVIFTVNVTDYDGYTDIDSVNLRWHDSVYPMSVVPGSGSGFTALYTATVSFSSGQNDSGVYPLEIRMIDSKANDSGWIDSGRAWKVWDCQVPVTGTLYDGSAGQACNQTGFEVAADSKLNFSSLIYKDVSGSDDVNISTSLPANYGPTNITYGKDYLPILNGGDISNIDGNIQGTARFTRVIDLGVGTTNCPTSSQFNLENKISAYVVAPRAQIDLSYIRDQEGWFQVAGAGVRAKNEIGSGVPFTMTENLRALSIGGTNADNGLISFSTFSNLNGFNNDSAYGTPNDWWIDQNTNDGTVYNYQYFYNNFLIKNEVGITGRSWDEKPDDGVYFVNGDLNIDSNFTLDSGKFFMVVVKGKISVDNSVTNLDGIYVADKGIEILGNSENQLVINGMLYSRGKIRLARSYTDKNMNNSSPAILVNYNPALIFNMPGKLLNVMSGWREE